MKTIFGALALGLLVGCTTPINGKYDVDIEYKSRAQADWWESTGNLKTSKEEFRKDYLEDLKARQFDAVIDYPLLTVKISYPDKPTRTVVFNVNRIDQNRYVVTKYHDPTMMEFIYDPVERTFSSQTDRYIKR